MSLNEEAEEPESMRITPSPSVEDFGDNVEDDMPIVQEKDHTADLNEIKESLALLTSEVGKINLKLNEKEKSATNTKPKEKLPKNYTLPSENDYSVNLEYL